MEENVEEIKVNDQSSPSKYELDEDEDGHSENCLETHMTMHNL